MPPFLRALLFLFLPLPAGAQPVDWAEIMAEAAWDWRPGDLIFRNGLDDIDEMIRQAEGGRGPRSGSSVPPAVIPASSSWTGPRA
ncbi:MAG: hypothetical protein Q4G26_05355 [Paracoccus sp. (in: a-proteobacteria)]|nr:hypothetical protein [Paracoccus sp. (in: a-proteobacteria)]